LIDLIVVYMIDLLSGCLYDLFV